MAFEQHFRMTPADVVVYVKEKLQFFPAEADLEAQELSDGNVNYVYRVVDKQNGKSLVVKQADKYLRCNGRPVSTDRSRIESEILSIQRKLAPDYVPEIYLYDPVMCTLSMEDVSAYKNMRKELLQGKRFPKFAEDITSFMADTLLPTTDLLLSRAAKKMEAARFVNVELCDITEDLVLSEPYTDYKKQNSVMPENSAYVEKHLYKNEKLLREVGKLKARFQTHSQALIHGDLHTGSIFVNEQGLKVIDPEFAFYGPMGYDVGNVIANLIFAWGNRLLLMEEGKEKEAFLAWVESAVVETYDLFKKKAAAKLEGTVTDALLKEPVFLKWYIGKLMADSMGYAGTELHRRTVGDAKVAELTGVQDEKKRAILERLYIDIGVEFIKHRSKYKHGKDLVPVFQAAVEKHFPKK